MGLGAPFWAAAGDGVRWMHDWSSYHSSTGIVDGTRYTATFLSNVKLFQLPFAMNGADGIKQNAPQYDAGFFFWGTSATVMKEYSFIQGCVAHGGDTGTYTTPMWKQIHYTSSTRMTNGDIPPKLDVDPLRSKDFYSGIVQTGFLSKIPFDSNTTNHVVTWTMLPSAGTYKFWHYNPWAWYGTVPAVIADIVMKCGIDSSEIDQAAFDNAHDAYDLTTGDAPWTTAAGLVTKWEIGCSRRVGEKCISLVMECARHSRDMYFVNEAGILSVNSFTRWLTGGNYVTGLTLDDGVINVNDWGYESRYLYTKYLASWGSGVVVSGNPEYAPPNATNYTASEDETMESYLRGLLEDYYDGSDAVLDWDRKYGELWLKGRQTIINKTGIPRVAQKVHFPFSFSPHRAIGRYTPLYNWQVSDSKPRRFVSLTQDMRALDWSIGAHLTAVTVTDDGQTIDNAWCIERTYDFDRLTVASVLMEQPSNT